MNGANGVARLCTIGSSGELSPLRAGKEFHLGEQVLASLCRETRPLVGAALRELRGGAQDALTLLVPPRPAPEAARSDSRVTSFLASGGWIRSLLAGEPCSAMELCYRALSFALADTEASVALRVVDRETMADHPIAGGDATIDVLVPHRGDDRHLRVALAGLARQTHRCHTILCFDQAPEPGLVRNLKAQDDLDLFAITPAPSGPYVPRQHFGMASAARYIAFQDSDDVSLPSRLAAQVALAEAQGADIVGCHELRCDEIKRTVEAIRYPLDVNRALDLGVGSVQLFPTTIVRSDTLRRLGGFSTSRTYAADRHFQLRAHWSARILNLDAFLYVRRRRASSLSTSASTGMRSPERLQIVRAWDDAFQELRKGPSAAAESVFGVEHARGEFTIHDLRGGTHAPAMLRAHEYFDSGRDGAEEAC